MNIEIKWHHLIAGVVLVVVATMVVARYTATLVTSMLPRMPEQVDWRAP